MYKVSVTENIGEQNVIESLIKDVHCNIVYLIAKSEESK